MPPSQTNIHRPPNILIVDSGVGGLSICLEILSHGKALNLHYLSDNQAFPYGEKTEAFLIQRVGKLTEAALEKIAADIIVIACNTASTVVLPSLRRQLILPVVGVVPAIKTAAKLTNTGTFGLLATPGTVARSYTQQLIGEFAADKSVLAVGSSELVELIEAYLYGSALPLAAVEKILDEFDQQPGADAMDTVVLGCTHFPLIQKQLSALRPQWRWVDSSSAIANRVFDLLGPDNLPAGNGENHAWFTATTDASEQLKSFLNTHSFAEPGELSV